MSIRHDWYQTDQKVVVEVMLKNAVEKNYAVHIEAERVEVTAQDYKLELHLLRPINAEASSHKAMSSKIEITLIKTDGGRWDSLERTTKPIAAKPKVGDWDKLAKEIEKKEEEERSGEDALQALFKQIYNTNTAEGRRAMNKSFSESNGTVLSTNWGEVSGQTVDVRPPDGTEFKQWNS